MSYTDSDTDTEGDLREALAKLKLETLTRIKRTVENREQPINIGTWLRYDASGEKLCGCLLMDGFVVEEAMELIETFYYDVEMLEPGNLDYAPDWQVGGYVGDAANWLAEAYGEPPESITAAASAFDDWAQDSRREDDDDVEVTERGFLSDVGRAELLVILSEVAS